MTETVLEISNLAVTFDTPDGDVEAVKGVSFQIKQGECLGIVGESGSGKSQTFLAAFGLTSANARVSGSVKFQGREVLGLPRRELDQVRGRHVAFVFQDPLTALTPHLTIETQMGEVLEHHFKVTGEAARERCIEWLERVRIPEAARRLTQYPHELSGGMRQRVMIGMAMMAEPALLIADEPTTALDATVQAQVLDLIEDLQKDTNAAVALITHDMGVIARMAQRVAVMRRGEVVETGTVQEIFSAPKADYTKMLLKAVPRIDGERYVPLDPPEAGAPILKVEDVRVTFPVKVKSSSLFGANKPLRAVDGVSFKLNAGETLGIVGESGCGKSTLARAVVQLLPRNAGDVTFLGRNLLPSEREAIRQSRKDLQIVFQDPLASLDPRMTLGSSIAEPLLAFEPTLTRDEREERVKAMMTQVGLDPDLINRYPHELSGGQNQRVGVARAMILRPKLVVCDEAVSALDVSIQAQILKLLADLQREYKTSFLFISHDLAVVREISHNVLVLYLGRAVEYGPAEVILRDPRHPYTKALLAAAPTPDPDVARNKPRVRLVGDLPSPLDTRAPLRFLKSRIIDDPDAVQYRPQWIEVGPGHYVAEHDPASVAA
ncbi:ABC transporter ATP-binding protein [Candidatus Viadribacter manganicus]|uniref:ABC transporter ATP-binding protein n=1 Tax=Candidatus Viadribacter manganicus TaxID=1759059 RepID=A0A1B1AG01_9PROT|nr:ABC transporter ATP-binding protein [Candidatus Viadribacter manganicus]ANP45489.1 ABC transporter ATP-binding protein [Candidatus Viadribacter manganicus]